MASLLSSLKSRLLGDHNGDPQPPCAPPPPPRDPSAATCPKRRGSATGIVGDDGGRYDESASDDARQAALLSALKPIGSFSEFDCDVLLEDFGGSATPSTPESSDPTGYRFKKLHHMAECIECCQFPKFEPETPALDKPEEVDMRTCLDILDKYCPNAANPSKQALHSLKDQLSDEIRRLKWDVRKIGGDAEAARAEAVLRTDDQNLPPLDTLIQAMKSGRVGIIGRRPEVKCDYPPGSAVPSLETAIEVLERKIEATRQSTRKLKKFQDNMKRLAKGEDVRGLPILLEAEASATRHKLQRSRDVFNEMFAARVEWEMYLAKILSMLSSEGIVARFRTEIMNRFKTDPPTFGKVVYSIMTTALVVDEAHVHSCRKNVCIHGPGMACHDPCHCQSESSESDKCRKKPDDPTPVDVLKELLLTTRSNVEVLAQDMNSFERSVKAWTEQLVQILDDLMD